MENITKRNNLKKPKSDLILIVIPIFIMLIGIGVTFSGLFRQQKNLGLIVAGLVISVFMMILVIAILMQNVINSKKFAILEQTLNVHPVKVIDVKESYTRIKSELRLVGYYVVCKFENKELHSLIYKKSEYKIKKGYILNLYLPESGLKHNAVLKTGYDYYIDLEHILPSDTIIE